MAISTENVYLIYQDPTDSSTWAKLVDIKSFPDMGKEPSTIEVTTLSDPIKKYIEGLRDTGILPFDANYSLADYNKIEGLKGKTVKFGLQFGKYGTNGSKNGVFVIDGQASAVVKGAGTEAAMEMTVNIVVEDMKFDSSSNTTNCVAITD